MALKRVGVQLTAEGASAFDSAISNANKLTENFGSVAQKASGGIDKLSVATVALGTALGQIASAGLAKIVEGFTSFVGSGFELNNSLEQATAKLVAFTGSAEAAAEVLAMVKERAASTPFEFDEMANSAAGLAAVSKTTGESLEGLLGIAERLAASNPAEGLEGAAFSLREAFSGDFVSLQDRFNVPKDVIKRLKETGFTLEALDKELANMGITADLVTGLAATAEGRISTFKDTISELAGALTQPIFDSFKTILERIQPILDNSKDSIKAFGNALGKAISAKILDAFQFLYDSVVTFQQALKGNWVDNQIVQPFHRVVGIVGSVVAQFDLVKDAIGRLMEGKSIDSYIEAIARNLSEVFGLKLSSDQFQAITDGIGATIDKITEFGRIAKEVFDGFSNGGIAGGLATLQPYVEQVFSQIAAYVRGQLPSWMNTLAEYGRGAWQWIVDATPTILSNLASLMTTIPRFILDNREGIIAAFSSFGQAAWQWLGDAIPPLLTKASEFVEAARQHIADHLPDWINSFLGWATASVTWLGDAIPDLITKAGEWLASLTGWFLSDGLPGLRGETDKMQDASVVWIAEAGKKIWPKAAEFLVELLRSMQRIEDSLVVAAESIGEAIINSIVDGLNDLAYKIRDALSAIITVEVQKAINDALAALATVPISSVSPVPDPEKEQGGGTVPKSSSLASQRVNAPPPVASYSTTTTTQYNTISVPVYITGGSSDTYTQARDGILDGLRQAGIR